MKKVAASERRDLAQKPAPSILLDIAFESLKTPQTMPAPRETIESKPPSLEANLKHSDARTPESTRARAGSHDFPRRNGRDGPTPKLT